LTRVRKNGALPYLRPDGRPSDIETPADQPVRLDTVVVFLAAR